jgi:hypothetical protein
MGPPSSLVHRRDWNMEEVLSWVQEGGHYFGVWKVTNLLTKEEKFVAWAFESS